MSDDRSPWLTAHESPITSHQSRITVLSLHPCSPRRRLRNRFLHLGTLQMRREHLDESIRVATQVVVSPDANVYGVGLEQVLCFDRAQAFVASLVVRHVGHDCNAQPKLD